MNIDGRILISPADLQVPGVEQGQGPGARCFAVAAVGWNEPGQLLEDAGVIVLPDRFECWC